MDIIGLSESLNLQESNLVWNADRMFIGVAPLMQILTGGQQHEKHTYYSRVVLDYDQCSAS